MENLRQDGVSFEQDPTREWNWGIVALEPDKSIRRKARLIETREAAVEFNPIDIFRVLQTISGIVSTTTGEIGYVMEQHTVGSRANLKDPNWAWRSDSRVITFDRSLIMWGLKLS